MILKGAVRLCYAMDEIGDNANLAKNILKVAGMEDKANLVPGAAMIMRKNSLLP